MNNIFKTLLAICLLCFVSCIVMAQNNIIDRKYDIKNFSSIAVSGGWDIYLSQGEYYEVKVEADKKSLDNLIISVKEEVLSIENEHATKIVINTNRKPRKRNIYITMPEINNLVASGGSDIYCLTPIKSTKLSMTLSGSSDVKRFTFNGEELVITASGSSDVNVEFIDVVNSVNITASGSSDMNIKKVNAKKFSAVLSGGSDMDLYGQVDDFNLNVSGSSDVKMNNVNINKLSVTLTGGSDFNVVGQIEDMILTASGGSEIKLTNNNGSNFSANLTGGSDMDLHGQVENFDLMSTGSSDVNASSFKVKNCRVVLTSGANAELFVTSTLDATVNGSSNLYYKGNPPYVTKSKSSNGKIKSL